MSFKNTVQFKSLVIGLLATTLLDFSGSLISKMYTLDYTYFVWISYIVRISVGYFAALHNKGILIAIIFGAVIGFFDATVGWFISHSLSAFSFDSFYNVTFEIWIYSASYVTAIGAIFSLIGGLLYTIKIKKRV